MKELSIEEKAKCYDKVVERLKDFRFEYRFSAFGDVIEEKFPELKESKGERIRKALIDYFRWNPNSQLLNEFTNREVFAWLEKQGAPTEDELEALRIAAYEPTKNWSEKLQSLYEKLIHYEQGEQKPADKVEPKFKVGDRVVHDMSDGKKIIRQIINMTNKSYVLDGEDFNTFYFKDLENDYHLWTIQDAKDGDVLSDGTTIFMFKDLLSDGSVISHCDYDTDTGESDAFCPSSVNLICSKITPATKEQRDTLEKAMADAGYTFDFDKKELRKIEQNPAWIEEDERIYKVVLELIDSYSKGTIGGYIIPPNVERYVKWFKALKDRIQPKQEWSEEDRDYYDAIITKLEITQDDASLTDNQMEFLRSLKDRYTWKPSNEHYELEEFAKIVRANLTGISKVVQELFEAKYLQLTGNKMYGGYKD